MDTKQEDEQVGNTPTENIETLEEQGKKEGFTVSRGVQTVVSTAVIVATLFTLWNPRKIFGTPNIYDLFQSEAAIETAVSGLEVDDGAIQIGILAGHWENSTGEVCADGTIEADINFNIANRVKVDLEGRKFQVDLFPEFDLDLLNYDADALVAIYSGSCLQNPLPPSGFKIGTSLTAENPDMVNELAVCLAENYQESTRLLFTYEVINPDHPSYHIFRDIHPNTPAVLIEIGMLSTDRDLIENRPTSIVEGITAGIECFLESNASNTK
ncbi:MAG: N-acetylmuramoyl-L-alanine amidase [Pelolinea sp.]|nr:N-acetylmuramoyl-L-alanine amidase [Pelolinea sp.]